MGEPDNYNLCPRLCILSKRNDFNGFGFNLHAEKTRSGQFIGKIDPESPAERGNLKQGDRLVEVDGVQITNENHQQVVARIRASGDVTRLLVVDTETDKHFKENNELISSSHPKVKKCYSDEQDNTEDVIGFKYLFLNRTLIMENTILNTSDGIYVANSLRQMNDRFLQLQTARAELDKNLDAFFLLVMGIIIYLMQCGFAFLEAGSVRSKNTVNILIKNLLDSFVSGLSYWLVGYAFAFGEGNAFIGHNKFAHSVMTDPDFAAWFFQFVFAATAATIVSGSVAERCDFNAYLVYSFILTGFVYPVVTHWAWSSEGWLAKGFPGYGDDVTFQDFAGSGVVHTVGGTVAFMGALFLGARKNRFDAKGKPLEIRGHSVPLASLGGFILLFGFFAFNGGSQGHISQPGDGLAVAKAMVNTILAASGGAFTALLVNKTGLFGDSKWSLLLSLNGCLSGMVAVCAGCDSYHSYGAFCVGVIGGITYMCYTWLVLRLKVDDPLDATAVHFGGGTAGIILAPFFDTNHGILYYWDKISGLKLAWNLIGLIAIIAWALVLSLLIFAPLKLLGILRVSEEFEDRGLDLPKHGEEAYPLESYGHGWGEKGDHISTLVAAMAKQCKDPKDKRFSLPVMQKRDSGFSISLESEVSKL